MPHRPERLAEMIRDELTELLEGELADPRIGLVEVARVEVDSPTRLVHVAFTIAGEPQEQGRTMAGLMAARGFLRAEIGRRLQLHRMPELRFELDRSQESTARIDDLLTRAHKRQAARLRRQQKSEED
ncbi:MAG: 30S ribosome-binding factor RbfA [Terriglobales bacterium]